ncbi:hypothetical protein [Nocardia carnea]|uniref:hypothetical protein n=1 Tax=Nocardia carnea TaxID=37328 RepID=UPI00245672A8|nr:hypothetical protein [Nocardia carnea]
MHNSVIAGLGALGAWLLVAGPLYQAAMELRDRGLTDRRNLPAQIMTGRHVSAWWWLVPPVAYWKHHQRREQIKRRALEVLPLEEVERMVSFSNTALAWMFVSTGAALIAVKETYEWVEIAHLPQVWTWVVIVSALGIAVGNAAGQTARTTKILSQAGRTSGG